MAWAEPRVHADPPPPPTRTQRKLLLYSSLLLSLIGLSAGPCNAGPAEPARLPLLSGQPFIIFWGIQDSSCAGRLNPTSFGMEREGRVAVFYEDSLGNYPYFLDKNTPVNGGIPQHTRLDGHVQKTKQDLEASLPAPRYLGLGVLRWAEWVPQWSRNQEKQAMYLDASRKLLRSFFPKWSREEVEKWSKVDFEAAAQSVMVETLREVKRLRPKALWGFSPYPSCYNSDPAQTQQANYSGQCPPAEMALNDELLWLWRRSTALFPLLTLEKRQGGTVAAKSFLSSQIRETLRVASVAGAEFDLPVFPLVKSAYDATKTFLSQADLINTIGESAAMGTAGIVIWERSEIKTERECQDLAVFVRKVLGPYAVNVTTATQSCSASLCQGKGRCVRQNPESSIYLHLPSQPSVAEKAPEKAGEAPSTDQPDAGTKPDEPDPAEIWKKDFQCQWYKSADGALSERQSPKDGVSVGDKAEGNTGNKVETRSTSTTKSASESTFRGRDFDVTASQTASLGLQTDSGTNPLNAPNLYILFLLLGATCLCLLP